MSKILLLDIEMAPNVAHVWGIWDQNIGINQLQESSYVMCYAAKWLGDKKMVFDSVKKSGDKKMLEGIHKLLDEADAVIHYNGKRFDIPSLNKEFLLHGMFPPAPFKEQVCRPAQDILEKKINRIIGEMTDALEIKFNELALTDEDTMSKIDERYLRMKVITPNEVRIRKGMVPLEGGDEVVELKPEQQAEIRTQASGNRLRDQERQNNQPDISGEARNEQGAGRQVE